MHWLALHARGPGQRWGGGAVLALLGLRWGRASDALACTVRLQSSAKMGGVSGARFAWLGLLGLVCSACVGVEPLTHCQSPHVPESLTMR
jgi:hypothetical protein